MKKIEVLVFILFVSFVGFGQKQKVIDKKVKNQCEYKRQKGKRIIIKNDSLGYISYKTKNSELIIYEYHFLGFTAETKEGAKKDYLYSDSLITMLFINGLLTSDLLIKEYCNQSAYFYNKNE